MSDNQKEYVLLHEKAHLSRHDNLWKPIGFILLAIYWFNPLVWIAYHLFSKDIELATDEKVINNLNNDEIKDYSKNRNELMTYYEKNSGSFAALGHGIIDIDTGELVTIANGDITNANILNVVKGQKGIPGEIRGSIVNQKMKRLAGNSSATYTTEDTTITAFRRSDTISATYKTSEYEVQTAESNVPIYMWYDSGTIYYWSEASTIYMNRDSQAAFRNFSNLTNISELAYLDASKVEDMLTMFDDNTSLTSLAGLENWDVSNGNNFSYMFCGCSKLRKLEIEVKQYLDLF